MTRKAKFLTIAMMAASLAACAKEGRLVVTDGVGITAVRGVCPAVGIPDYTGDVTYFTGNGRSQNNLSLTANMTNLRSTCDDSGERVYTGASFDIHARRYNTNGAQTLTIPYFVTVLQGGANVQSKRVGEVKVSFADGEARAMVTAKAGAYIDRASATLPPEIREKITRKRRPGDEDAALDPLADPEVREALKKASFEVLLGFQMSDEQLAYNVTR